MDYLLPLREKSFQAQAVHALRQLRYCGDAYLEDGWPVVNQALAQYALERWRERQWRRAMRRAHWVTHADADYDMDDDPATEPCHYCHGDGFGIVGLDWDGADGVNGPYEGECETCPCCNGSSKEADATFW